MTAVAPLIMSMVVGTYLVDELDDSPTTVVKWQGIDVAAEDRDKTWQVTVAGIPMKTSDLEDGDYTPELVELTEDRMIIVSQAGGRSQPGWGLDLHSFRVHTLAASRTTPALLAEDMLERVKNSVNSINGKEIWRQEQVMSGSGSMIDYNIQQLIQEETAMKDIIPDLHKVIDSDDAVPSGYVHVANWASTILTSGTVIQEVTDEVRGTHYVAYSVDFRLFTELIHQDVLGFRDAFVDARTA